VNPPAASIILRSFNEAWALRETLPALRAQNFEDWELIVIDSGSTDGSQELIRAFGPVHFVQIQPCEYNPGRVLNHGMRLARAEFGIFLNADATPQGSDWLRPLVDALSDARVASVFGRQVPRPDCQAVYACDYDRCFGPNRESARWDHFFSMVSSGMRKDIWSRRGFLEKLQFAEDDEYTRWARGSGHRVVYCPESVVTHSHNYTPAQAYQRSFGDARALAASWRGTPRQFGFWKTRILGTLSDLQHDIRFCARENRLRELPHAARIRWEQRRGKLEGFREGWTIYRRSTHENPGSNQPISTALPRGI
jgi:rhamnosyltransferase